MKVALTSKKIVTSKKNGLVYQIYAGVSESGKAIQMFLDEAQVKEFNLPEAIVPSKESLAQIFEILPVVEASFDDTGRLEDISV